MRTITTHAANGSSDALSVAALTDNRCVYQICHQPAPGVDVLLATLRFQNGPIREAGINGISNEAMLAVVQDRLEGFQAGEFPCDANERALTHIKAAMEALHERTRDRMTRSVEDTNQP